VFVNAGYLFPRRSARVTASALLTLSSAARPTVGMQEILASMTSKSAAWFIFKSALSTLVVTITWIVIAQAEDRFWEQYLLGAKTFMWAIRVAAMVATLGSGSSGDGTSLSTPLTPLDCGGCSLNQLLGLNATSMVQTPM
jgi:hypothetical protein